MRLLTVYLICASMIVSVWCARFTEERFKHKFAKRMRQFSGDMYRTIVESDPGKNVIFSPLSIYHTCGMLSVGSAQNTKHQLLRAMRLTKKEDEFTEEKINKLMSWLLLHTLGKPTGTNRLANALFLQAGFPVRSSFQNTLRDSYRAEVQKTDFRDARKSATTINDWVAEITSDTITDLVTEDKITDDTKLVLVNAIYFKNKWDQTFNEMPEPITFTLYDGTDVSVKAMFLKMRFHYRDIDNIVLYAIPYSGKETYFVLGRPSQSTGLATFTESASEKLSRLDPVQNWPRTYTKLIMPKFKVEQEIDVKQAMESLEVRDLFSPRSNLSRINDEKLYVSDFLHKAFIEVNEKGTEAAAATAAIIVGRFAGIPKTVINQPFFYGIWDRNAEIFTFLGQITDPRTSDTLKDDRRKK